MPLSTSAGAGCVLGLDKAARMAALAAQRDILFSVHAPYYISMSSLEEDKRLNSIQYLLHSAAVCRALGGRRIIFHSGSCGRQSREAALEKALDTLKRRRTRWMKRALPRSPSALRRWERSASWARWRRCWPSAGWTGASPPASTSATSTPGRWAASSTKADYAAILDRLETALGDERARRFHVHFSRIEFSKGGEKRHWTFAETQFGPEPQPLMELLAERKLQPVIICESAGTQAEDAGAMQQMYHAACKT